MAPEGVSFGSVSESSIMPKPLDSEARAQEYANKRGISLEQAREELRASKGEPTQGGAEAYAQQYATEHGISIEKAREELRAKYGDPTQGAGGAALSTEASAALSTGDVDGTGRQPSIPPEAMTLHYSYGIPLEVIQEGDNAIQQYAKENNIQLPEKTQGSSINFES